MSELSKAWGGPAKPVSAAEYLEKNAICELAKIYSLGIDLKDYDLCRSAFAPDAVGILFDQTMPIDKYLEATYGVGVTYHGTQHLIAQQHVKIKGDEAEMWSYGIAHHKVAPGEKRDQMIVAVQYRDKCRRFPEGWLIVERSTLLQWIDMGEAPSPKYSAAQ